jgi:hypothetical protein
MDAKKTTKTLLALIVLVSFSACCTKAADVESKNGNPETIVSKAKEIERKSQEYYDAHCFKQIPVSSPRFWVFRSFEEIGIQPLVKNVFHQAQHFLDGGFETNGHPPA